MDCSERYEMGLFILALASGKIGKLVELNTALSLIRTDRLIMKLFKQTRHQINSSYLVY